MKHLTAFKKTPHNAVLRIYSTFSIGLERQILNFDNRDETLRMVLRFPGLPDAVGGSIRGMQSYTSWLYFGRVVDFHFGYHYGNLDKANFVEDYVEILEAALGRKVEVVFSKEKIDSLDFLSTLIDQPRGADRDSHSVTQVFLRNGRVLFGGGLTFENEQQLKEVLASLCHRYGNNFMLVSPRTDKIISYTPEWIESWIADNPGLFPYLTNARRNKGNTPVSVVPVKQLDIPFDLIIFDFDNTLAFTTPLASFRAPEPASGETWEKSLECVSVPPQLQDFLINVKNFSKHTKLAIISKAPRWYLDYLIEKLYPDVVFDAILGYDDARSAGGQYKPHPALLEKLMHRFASSTERTLVIGDEFDDVEMAYRAGVRCLVVDFYSGLKLDYLKSQQKDPDWSHFNVLKSLPHAVCTNTEDLKDVICDLTVYDFLIEFLNQGGELNKSKRKPRHGLIDYYSENENRWCPVIVLGRYLIAENQDRGIFRLPSRGQHILTHQILEKEDGTVEVPQTWVDAVVQTLKAMAITTGKRFIITILPARTSRPQRLENLLMRVKSSLASEGEQFQFDPSVFAFSLNAPSNKKFTDSSARSASLAEHLNLSPEFQPQIAHSYVVIDDVTTTGSTFSRTRELLTGRGIRSDQIKDIALAKALKFSKRSPM